MVGGVAKIGDGCIWTRVFCQDGVSVQGFEEWVCVAVELAFDWSTFRNMVVGREKRGACVATRFIYQHSTGHHTCFP